MTQPSQMPLPEQSVPLSNQGLQKLLAYGRENPSAVAQVVTELKTDPKGAIGRLFKLSPSQQAAISQTPDNWLAARIAPAILALQEGHLTGWEFDPGMPSGPEVAAISGYCNCGFKF